MPERREESPLLEEEKVFQHFGVDENGSPVKRWISEWIEEGKGNPSKHEVTLDEMRHLGKKLDEIYRRKYEIYRQKERPTEDEELASLIGEIGSLLHEIAKKAGGHLSKDKYHYLYYRPDGYLDTENEAAQAWLKWVVEEKKKEE